MLGVGRDRAESNGGEEIFWSVSHTERALLPLVWRVTPLWPAHDHRTAITWARTEQQGHLLSIKCIRPSHKVHWGGGVGLGRRHCAWNCYPLTKECTRLVHICTTILLCKGSGAHSGARGARAVSLFRCQKGQNMQSTGPRVNSVHHTTSGRGLLRPSNSTGLDGPADVSCAPRSSFMLRMRWHWVPATAQSPTLIIPAMKRATLRWCPFSVAYHQPTFGPPYRQPSCPPQMLRPFRNLTLSLRKHGRSQGTWRSYGDPVLRRARACAQPTHDLRG